MRGYTRDDKRWIDVDDVGLFAFSSNGPVEVVRSASEDELWDVWVRSILPLVVQDRRTEVLHASAYARDDGTVTALAGRMMAGKSTLAIAVSHDQSWTPIADDALPFAFRDDDVVVRPLPFRIRLRPPATDLLGADPVEHRDSGGEASLRGVVILSPGEVDHVTAERLSPADALGALMPHAYCFSLAASKQTLVENYARLTERTPVWRVEYRQQPDRMSEVVDCLATLTE
jgi:hypothetical protein